VSAGPRFPVSDLIVVDASVLADALCGVGDAADAARKAIRGRRWAAPEHLRIETFSVIRGRTLGGKLSTQAGERAVRRLEGVAVRNLSCSPMLDRMWQLRDNLSGYDAAYVAAAELLAAPLVTGDRRVAAAPGLRCRIVVPA
jgi:predicted nucleic acid-binding protein